MGDTVATEVKRFKRRKQTAVPPIPFYLGDDLFHAVAALPGGRILDFAALTSLSEEQQALLTKEQQDEAGRESLAAVTDLFATAIVPNDKTRWHAATREIADDGSVVLLQEMMEIAGWLVGVYAANPTGGFSPDTPAEDSTEADSSPGAPSGATTYSRPQRPKRSR